MVDGWPPDSDKRRIDHGPVDRHRRGEHCHSRLCNLSFPELSAHGAADRCPWHITHHRSGVRTVIGRVCLGVATALLLAGVVPVLAQQAQHAGQRPESGYRAEFLQDFDMRAERVLALAEAFPQELYTWRPGEGVRSVSEVLLHVAAGGYGLMRFGGVEPPAGFEPQGFEQSTTEKAQIIQELRRAFDHVRQAAAALPEDEEAQAGWFGGSNITQRHLAARVNGHMGEHLGQLIAYARTNDIVPPWSR